jgi:hypothetical protein
VTGKSSLIICTAISASPEIKVAEKRFKEWQRGET